MRRLPLLLSLACLLTPVGTAAAEQKAQFHFGLESRFGAPREFSDAQYSWGVIPNFSYHPTERIRLDAFAALGYSDLDGLFLNLQPGLRYYLGSTTGKFRWNTGFAVAVTVIDEGDARGGPVTDAADLPTAAGDDYWLRLVPIEIEYWGPGRWGLTAALDYQSRLGGDPGVDDSGFGLAAGLRFRIR